jgi:hypothetical protein
MDFPPRWKELYNRPMEHNGFTFIFTAAWYAKMRTDDGQEYAVTDYDCQLCRYERLDDGDDFCQHQEAMFAVLVHDDDQAAADYHDEQTDRRAVLDGVA